MPMLLEDLAQEASASNRRVADRLDAEVRDLDALRHAVAAVEEIRPKAIESARQATDYAVSRAAQAEAVWRSALASLRTRLTSTDTERLLHNQLELFESGQRLVRGARALWAIPEQMGVTPERLEELDRAERRFEDLAADARLALQHRATDWQPTDPARLEAGLQSAAEGKTVDADQARARFRGGSGLGGAP